MASRKGVCPGRGQGPRRLSLLERQETYQGHPQQEYPDCVRSPNGGEDHGCSVGDWRPRL
eukprot:6245964-Prymnesium_polylepis.1